MKQNSQCCGLIHSYHTNPLRHQSSLRLSDTMTGCCPPRALPLPIAIHLSSSASTPPKCLFTSCLLSDGGCWGQRRGWERTGDERRADSSFGPDISSAFLLQTAAPCQPGRSRALLQEVEVRQLPPGCQSGCQRFE